MKEVSIFYLTPDGRTAFSRITCDSVRATKHPDVEIIADGQVVGGFYTGIASGFQGWIEEFKPQHDQSATGEPHIVSAPPPVTQAAGALARAAQAHAEDLPDWVDPEQASEAAVMASIPNTPPLPTRRPVQRVQSQQPAKPTPVPAAPKTPTLDRMRERVSTAGLPAVRTAAPPVPAKPVAPAPKPAPAPPPPQVRRTSRVP